MEVIHVSVVYGKKGGGLSELANHESQQARRFELFIRFPSTRRSFERGKKIKQGGAVATGPRPRKLRRKTLGRGSNEEDEGAGRGGGGSAETRTRRNK
ncbi:hypothetical protein EVAR_36886_1 [Eumeta japonica]|uniref:Uncharacterized protein n=1 Tax=Eumeta variegata TaxID=151549 RepID=A0A4C1WSQ4_EUMVA|nr:hypothetical protein EVAR_36886_1 [Eumeta japonica]